MTGPIAWQTQLENRRRRLGMSKRILAKRAGISLPTVNRILAGKEKRPAIGSVQALAVVLGVVLRLGVEISLDEVRDALTFRKEHASEKARRLVRMVQSTMGLEAQAVDSQAVDEMIEQTTCELLAGPSQRLWDD
jgi:transcriptional regulator with XRE-family HTH domain